MYYLSLLIDAKTLYKKVVFGKGDTKTNMYELCERNDKSVQLRALGQSCTTAQITGESVQPDFGPQLLRTVLNRLQLVVSTSSNLKLFNHLADSSL